VPHDTNGNLDIFVYGEGLWSPQLILYPLQRGSASRAMICNGVAGETVWFLYTYTGVGTGPCPPVLGGLCLDLLNPIVTAASAVTAADNTADFTFFVPLTAPLVPVYGQAVIQRGSGNSASVKSNTVTETIQP